MFGEQIEPACLYCAFSQQAEEDCHLLCPKKGIVTPAYRCRHYRYDPTKRVPPRKQELPKLSPEEFKLD